MLFQPFLKKARFAFAISIFLGATWADGLSAGPAANQASAQINAQVAQFAAQPVKVTATTEAPAVVGTTSQIQIGLLNADSKPVPAKGDSEYEVSITPPSGSAITQKVLIKAGENMTQVPFSPSRPGVTSITVRPLAEGVRAESTMIVVRPPVYGKVAKGGKTKTPIGLLRSPDNNDSKSESYWATEQSQPKFQTVALALPAPESEFQPDGGGQPAQPAPMLHIFVDNIAGAHYATGKDAAVISAIYDSPDYSAAPTDIRIFFNMTTGALDPGLPLVILKGTFKGSAHLTSTSPADVHVTFTSSSPQLPSQGDTDFVIHFVPPIVQFYVPNQLSIVDNPTVTADFFDEHGVEMSTAQSYQVSLHSEQSKLKISPNPFQPPSGHADLFPTSVGSDTLDATVTYYPIQKLTIVITGWLVLGLCIAGGLAGGLAAYNKFQGSWKWRIFLGILGGAALCWLYVYLALPSITSNIAHNTISVFFIALIGGYGGTYTLDKVAQKFGIGGPKPAQPA